MHPLSSRDRSYMEFSVLSAQFCCEPNSAFKKSLLRRKKKGKRKELSSPFTFFFSVTTKSLRSSQAVLNIV